MLKDKSILSLIGANIFILFLVVFQGWSLLTLMLVYWCQSIIIGAFNFFRILALENFSTEDFKINGQPAEPTQGTKVYTAFFFAVHYGGFHMGYLFFIFVEAAERSMTSMSSAAQIDFSYVLIGALAFFVNHYFSYRYNIENDKKHVMKIGTLMATPYIRIIPMHLTILLGAFTGLPTFVFIILKTGADLFLHNVKHSKY